MESVVDHPRVEMAGTARRDRARIDPGGGEPARIAVGREVARDRAELVLARERARGLLEHRGLAGARRAHQVDREDLGLDEVLAQVLRAGNVVGEDVLVDLDRYELGVTAAAVYTHLEPPSRFDRGRCRHRRSGARGAGTRD